MAALNWCGTESSGTPPRGDTDPSGPRDESWEEHLCERRRKECFKAELVRPMAGEPNAAGGSQSHRWRARLRSAARAEVSPKET